MKTINLLPAAALLAIAAAAAAQPTAQRPDRDVDMTRQQVVERTDQAFARLDGNNDGRFTPEEARARGEQRRSERAVRMFERLDSDRDGSISRAEFDQGRAHRGGRRGSPGAEGGGRGHGPGMRHGRHGGRGMGMRGGRMFGEQGYLTREQFRERALARFDRADADRNGTLTAAERRGARQMRHRRGPGEAGGRRDSED